MCKTLGVVTTPKSITSTRNTIHAREGRAMQRVVRNFMLACKSREVSRYFASNFFDNSSLLLRFRFLGCDQICLSIHEKYLLVLSTATKMA